MKLAEITITVTTDNKASDEHMSELSGLFDEFTDKVDSLCNDFKKENPDIEITCS